MAKRLVDNTNFGFGLLELREEFGQLFLYTYNNYKFVFTPLLLSQFDSLVALKEHVSEYIIDEWVVKKSFKLSNIEDGLGYLLNEAPAGLVSSIALSIVTRSAPGDAKTIISNLEKERSNQNTDSGVITNIILTGAGTLLGKYHRRITAGEQIKYLALAESVTGKEIQTQTLDQKTKTKKKPMSPEAAALLSKEAADKPDFEADNKMFNSL